VSVFARKPVFKDGFDTQGRAEPLFIVLVAPWATATTSRRLSREPILRARLLPFCTIFKLEDGYSQDTF
jgi:hypothetical protein